MSKSAKERLRREMHLLNFCLNLMGKLKLDTKLIETAGIFDFSYVMSARIKKALDRMSLHGCFELAVCSLSDKNEDSQFRRLRIHANNPDLNVCRIANYDGEQIIRGLAFLVVSAAITEILTAELVLRAGYDTEPSAKAVSMLQPTRAMREFVLRTRLKHLQGKVPA